jgi:TPR repeat protein
LLQLAELLADHGYIGRAEQAYRDAAATGDPEALFCLGVWALENGAITEAEQALRDAAAAGHLDAAETIARRIPVYTVADGARRQQVGARIPKQKG